MKVLIEILQTLERFLSRRRETRARRETIQKRAVSSVLDAVLARVRRPIRAGRLSSPICGPKLRSTSTPWTAGSHDSPS